MAQHRFFAYVDETLIDDVICSANRIAISERGAQENSSYFNSLDFLLPWFINVSEREISIIELPGVPPRENTRVTLLIIGGSLLL